MEWPAVKSVVFLKDMSGSLPPALAPHLMPSEAGLGGPASIPTMTRLAVS